MIKTTARTTSKCSTRSYMHYSQILATAKDAGYNIAGFGQLNKLINSKRSVILRHDIDFSPIHALKLASIEYPLDVSSTYFVSLHRPHYSPLTREMRRTIHTLIELGHEIGLHYEPEFDDLPGEISMLEHYLDCKIVAIARHNPFGVHIDLDKVSKPKGVIDAYSDDIMSSFKYITDSSGIWREGCWCHHIGQKNKYQVLIHPEWWNPDTVDPVTILDGINSAWTASNNQQAQLSRDNLILHRKKIMDGTA